jgi:hypothetical protein
VHEHRFLSHVPSTNRARKRALRKWHFTLTDVLIIIGIALGLSGLMGLGAVMLVEIVDRLLR